MGKRFFLSILIIAVLVIINLYLKDLAKGMEAHHNLPGILEFEFAKNYGMTRGIFEGQKMIINIIMLSISSFLFFIVIRNSKSIYYISPIVLFLSRGIGNILDRTINGYVTDYVRFNIPAFSYFNMDDVLIIIGVSMFIYQSIFRNKRLVRYTQFNYLASSF